MTNHDHEDPAATEARAMRQRTNLTEPSRLLLRVRRRFVDSGGAPQAFDWAVNHYARTLYGERP